MAENEKDNSIYINRELSWLGFDLRVLDLAHDKGVPLGEQLNFAAIFASNLDEFFMVRVGSLYDQTLLKKQLPGKESTMSPAEQLRSIMPAVRRQQSRCDKICRKLFSRLEEYGYKKTGFDKLPKSEERYWKKYFLAELYPILSPQVIGRRHPFPFLRNESVYVGSLLRDSEGNESFGVVPIGSQFANVFFLQKKDRVDYVFAEDLIRRFEPIVFSHYKILESCAFRVTRNADIDIQEGMIDQDVDYRDVMSELLKKRRKLAAVRLQVSDGTSDRLISMLCQKLQIDKSWCFTQEAPLEMKCLGTLRSRLRSDHLEDLFYPPAKPLQPPAGFSLAEAARRQDVLLAYPYQSIRPFIGILSEAARDPDVISIKMTLYRLASDSKIAEALTEAAENGKEVVTVVELRARFDEQNNIGWSHELENAGCTVIYGFDDYKVHSKIMLITRRKNGKTEYLTQIGTGNYNEKTAELYADFCYVSSDQALGEEAAALFNDLAVEKKTETVSRLLVAPNCFKSVLLGEIDREIEAAGNGTETSIAIKCNAVSDRDLIKKLCEASRAGIRVDLIVRGICCFCAGVRGKSENIHVRSLVGRYLEHSRIYSFGSGDRQRIYIGSGDFLTRNTERRVEIGVRIDDPACRKLLNDVLSLQLRDTVNASEMQPDGSYKNVKRGDNETAVDSQMQMYQLFADVWNTLAAPPAEQPKTTVAQNKHSLFERIRNIFGRKG